MKRATLFLLVVITAMSCLLAQTTKNPFSKLGYNKKVMYTSSKGEFEEFHDNSDVVEIGSVYFNTKTNKVVGNINKENEKMEVASATSAMSVDPLCEKYYWISPYAFCLNNPVRFIDPDGREVKGVTRQDAQNFKDDIYKVLIDDKFANVRALIDVKGKTFNSINSEALNAALNGVTLSGDESAYVTMITGAINSKDIHKVEYVSGEFTSTEGAEAFRNHMNNIQEGFGDKALTPDGQLSSAWIRNSGDGLNVPTKNGSHSFIGPSAQGAERAVISGHEVFGHGIPSARKLSDTGNNSNAIRTDNLIRRILGLPQRDGSNHGGYEKGQIISPYILPILK